MHPDDIQLAREEIAKARTDVGYGPMLPMPFALLKHAIETIEWQRASLEAIKAAGSKGQARRIATQALRYE